MSPNMELEAPMPVAAHALSAYGSRTPGNALPSFRPNPVLDAATPRTRAPMLFGTAILGLFVAGFGAWSALAPLSEAAIAQGTIKVEGTRRTIQHLEGGIVREILVHDGDRVTAGQPLLRIQDVASDGVLEVQEAQRWELLAQDARLNAELRQARDVVFPAELLAARPLRARNAVAGQTALFQARRASLTSQLQVLLARIEQQGATISGARGQLQASRRQLELIRDEESMRRQLVQQGLARLPDLYAVQRTRASIEGQIEDLTAQIIRADASIAESRQQMQATIDQRLQEVSTDLGDVRTKLAEAEEKLNAASDARTRREVVAPEGGIIVNSKVFTVGGVVRAGDPLMDLMPERDRLVAEVEIQPNDIDVVHPGLRAEIRLPAFKQRLVPYLHGQVTWVAADVTANEQSRQQYYRTHIEIDRDQLAQLPNVFLTPGMPVEAHVRTGERSFFRYITQPLQDSFHRAFQEQ